MLDKLYEIKEHVFNKKILIIVFSFVLTLGCVISCLFFNNKEGNNTDLEHVVAKKEVEKVAIEEKCVVDIKGYVENVGLYEVSCNSRVNDVITLAGGLKDNADTSVINLSKKIKDGMVIVIYSKEEVSKFIEVKKDESIKEEKCKTSTVVVNDACISKNERTDTNNVDTSISAKTDNIDSSNADSTPRIISINTANLEDLMTLKGVGESKALAIISYREEHGPFNSIEDIKNVDGIGEKMFENIKDFITL